MSWDAASIVGGLAIVVTCITTASPIESLGKTLKGSTGQPIVLAGFQNLAMFGNNLIWVFYGILNEDRFVLIQNAISLLLATYVLYLIYEAMQSQPPKATMLMPISGVDFKSALTVIVALVCILGLLTMQKFIYVHTLGLIGVGFAISQFAAPLSSFKQVKTQGYIGDLLNLRYALLLLLTGFLWSTYGLTIQDMNIFFPNIIGSILSAIQIFVFCLVPPTKDGWGKCGKGCCQNTNPNAVPAPASKMNV